MLLSLKECMGDVHQILYHVQAMPSSNLNHVQAMPFSFSLLKNINFLLQVLELEMVLNFVFIKDKFLS